MGLGKQSSIAGGRCYRSHVKTLSISPIVVIDANFRAKLELQDVMHPVWNDQNKLIAQQLNAIASTKINLTEFY